MTTVPSIGSSFSAARIASTAAASAASLSPRPIQLRGGDRGGLGHPDHFEDEDAVEDRWLALTMIEGLLER